MRRFVLVIVTCALFGAPRAVASPFDNLSSRLKQYDDSGSITEQSQGRGPITRQLKQYDSAEPLPAPRQQPQRATPYQPPAAAPYQQRTATPYQQRTAQPEEIPHQPHEPLHHDDYVDDHSYGGDHDGPYDDYCDDGDCCDWGCGTCGPRFWGGAEYLYWWVRGSATPPLVTTSRDNTPQSAAGILPNATVLFGGDRLNSDGRPGGRFSGGYWFDPCGTFGIESSTFFLGEVEQVFDASSGGTPILAQPFFSINPLVNGVPGPSRDDAYLIAFPNFVIGQINISSTSRMVGTELNLRKACSIMCGRQIDLLVGYRFLQLSEGLLIDSVTTSVSTATDVDPLPPPVGTTFAVRDTFVTSNNFHGGQIGLNARYGGGGPWTLDLLAKVALGNVSQRVAINGSTVITPPGETPTPFTGGIFALNSNIGTYTRNRFAALPEFGVTLRKQISPCWRMSLGYSLLILSNAVRPGDQMDVRLDTAQFPPPSGTGVFPRFTFNDDDVWVQGISIGLERNF
jgi:hypothetical protein